MKKVIVLAILGIFLFSLVVSAQEDVLGGEESDFNLFSWLKHFFNIGEFSVVGDYRQCDNYATQVLYFDYGESMNQMLASNWCSPPFSLTDVYDSNWNPTVEYKGDREGMVCMYSQGCNVEIYCCPHPECVSNSQCVEWYGSGSMCMQESTDDPNINYMEGDTFNYCSEPSGLQITCWYYPGSGSVCLDRTYLGQDYCPSTYMEKTLYESQSVCVGSITSGCNEEGQSCDGPLNLPSGRPCCAGLDCQNFQCVTTGECTDGATKCEGEIYYTCESGTWDSQGRKDGECGYVSCGVTGDSCSSDSDCCSPLVCGGGFLGIGKTCRVEENGNGNGEELSIAYNESELLDLVSSQLLLAICASPDECPTDSSCKTLERIVEAGSISSHQNEFLHKDFCSSTSLWDRFFGDYTTTSSCGVQGSFAPKTTQRENFNSLFGLCIYKEEGVGLDSILGWAAFMDVDGDGDKDGVDGLIIVVGGFILIMMFSRMMIYGRYEYVYEK